METITLVNQHLVENPQSIYDYGHGLELARSPEIIYKHFGPAERFITSDGRIGIVEDIDRYIFTGNLSDYIDNIPITLKMNAEQTLKKFLSDVKKNVSNKWAIVLSKYSKKEFEDIMLTNTRGHNEIKDMIKMAIFEVVSEFEKKGIHLKEDPYFRESYLVKDQYKMVDNISNLGKIYINEHSDRYETEVGPYKNKSNEIVEKKKKIYFRKLLQEALENKFPKKEYLEWILNKKGIMNEETRRISHNSFDLYSVKVFVNEDGHEKEDDLIKISLKNLLSGNKSLNWFYENTAKVLSCDCITIMGDDTHDISTSSSSSSDSSKSKIINIIDPSKTLKRNKNNGEISFKHYKSNGNYDQYCFKNGDTLMRNDKKLGKFQLKEFVESERTFLMFLKVMY